MSVEFVDVGANLTHESFLLDLPDAIERSVLVGVKQLIVTATSEADSREALDLAGRYPAVLFTTAGVHPHHAAEWAPGTQKSLAELARNLEVVAIGATGLDFADANSLPVGQRAVFEAQLELACELRLPVYMYERGALNDFVSILGRYRDRLTAAFVHVRKGSERQCKAYRDLDLYVGVSAWICANDPGYQLRNIVQLIPSNRLLFATDSPYCLPRDLSPKPDSRRNEPSYLPHVVKIAATMRAVSLDSLAERSTGNARALFGLGPAL